MGNRWIYIPPMIIAIIDVTIDMHFQRMSTCAIGNEPSIMIFPRKHFNKGHLLRPPMALLKDTYACSQWILVSAKCCGNLSSIRRTRRGFTWTAFMSVRCNELWRCTSNARRESTFLPPRAGCHAHVCACVPRPRPSRLVFFSFRGKKSRCGAVNQSPRDRGERTGARKSHGGPGLMPVRLAC